MCADLVARVPLILQAALDAAATSPAGVASTLSDIREVIVFGGGSRIPIMQLAILSATKMYVHFLFLPTSASWNSPTVRGPILCNSFDPVLFRTVVHA